ncbi:MAG: YraN family protein [Lachnospiraceae bacterium]|nr:YraN family protein [Lachnospiraceae bacterium]
MNKRRSGNEHEERSVDYLEKNGVRIIDVNFSCKIGEIDIIGKDGDYLVFFEVKYRSSSVYGSPSEAVNYRKQKKICRVSDYFRLIKGIPEDTPIRYDVIAITGEEIDWIKNAFEYIGR